MEKLKFRTSEVISYCEEVLLMGLEDEHHEEVYYTYKWEGKVNRNTYAFKKVVSEMRKLYNESF